MAGLRLYTAPLNEAVHTVFHQVYLQKSKLLAVFPPQSTGSASSYHGVGRKVIIEKHASWVRKAIAPVTSFYTTYRVVAIHNPPTILDPPMHGLDALLVININNHEKLS